MFPWLHDRLDLVVRHSRPNSCRDHRAGQQTVASHPGSSIRMPFHLQTTGTKTRSFAMWHMPRTNQTWQPTQQQCIKTTFHSRLPSKVLCQPSAVQLQTNRSAPHHWRQQCMDSPSSLACLKAYAWTCSQVSLVCRTYRENCCDDTRMFYANVHRTEQFSSTRHHTHL